MTFVSLAAVLLLMFQPHLHLHSHKLHHLDSLAAGLPKRLTTPTMTKKKLQLLRRLHQSQKSLLRSPSPTLQATTLPTSMLLAPQPSKSVQQTTMQLWSKPQSFLTRRKKRKTSVLAVATVLSAEERSCTATAKVSAMAK